MSFLLDKKCYVLKFNGLREVTHTCIVSDEFISCSVYILGLNQVWPRERGEPSSATVVTCTSGNRFSDSSLRTGPPWGRCRSDFWFFFAADT